MSPRATEGYQKLALKHTKPLGKCFPTRYRSSKVKVFGRKKGNRRNRGMSKGQERLKLQLHVKDKEQKEGDEEGRQKWRKSNQTS